MMPYIIGVLSSWDGFVFQVLRLRFGESLLEVKDGGVTLVSKTSSLLGDMMTYVSSHLYKTRFYVP